MICPHCSESLVERHVRSHDIALDYCESCNAAWFDKGELLGLLGRDSSRQVGIPENAIRLDEMLCPRCSEPLHMFGYPGTGRVVEGCSKCEGIWLDKQDLEEIKGLPPDDSNGEKEDPSSEAATSVPNRPIEPVVRPLVRERIRYSEKYGLDFSRLLLQSGSLRIDQQIPPWAEQKLRLVAANSYRVRSIYGSTLGWVEEQGVGLREWIRRSVQRRERTCVLNVSGSSGEVVLTLSREPGALEVHWGGHLLGRVMRKGSRLEDGWKLLDARGSIFATIRFSGRPARESGREAAFDWRFRLRDRRGKGRGAITKKWSGAWKETMTDSDNFRIDFGRLRWTPECRAVIFAAAFAIDFDLFEDDYPEDGTAG